MPTKRANKKRRKKERRTLKKNVPKEKKEEEKKSFRLKSECGVGLPDGTLNNFRASKVVHRLIFF